MGTSNIQSGDSCNYLMGTLNIPGMWFLFQGAIVLITLQSHLWHGWADNNRVAAIVGVFFAFVATILANGVLELLRGLRRD
jgi:hypothetical protein